MVELQRRLTVLELKQGVGEREVGRGEPTARWWLSGGGGQGGGRGKAKVVGDGWGATVGEGQLERREGELI